MEDNEETAQISSADVLHQSEETSAVRVDAVEDEKETMYQFDGIESIAELRSLLAEAWNVKRLQIEKDVEAMSEMLSTEQRESKALDDSLAEIVTEVNNWTMNRSESPVSIASSSASTEDAPEKDESVQDERIEEVVEEEDDVVFVSESSASSLPSTVVPSAISGTNIILINRSPRATMIRQALTPIASNLTLQPRQGQQINQRLAMLAMRQQISSRGRPPLMTNLRPITVVGSQQQQGGIRFIPQPSNVVAAGHVQNNFRVAIPPVSVSRLPPSFTITAGQLQQQQQSFPTQQMYGVASTPQFLTCADGRKLLVINQNGQNHVFAPTTALQHQQQVMQQRMLSPINTGSFTGPSNDSSGSGSEMLLRMRSAFMNSLQQKPATILNQPAVRQKELTMGMELYAKKSNEIWQSGILVEIQNNDKPISERTYRLKIDGKPTRMLTAKKIAYAEPVTDDSLIVGARVIAIYAGPIGQAPQYYAGVVAEPASLRNRNRYLIFFDDGYAQYSEAQHIRAVCDQSRQVWEDVHPDQRDFIENYLQGYPERPMVRLVRGQVIKTELHGKWLSAVVTEVDSSLVRMTFDSMGTGGVEKYEWLYRGSTRLEPLYNELKRVEASKQAGRRRSNVNPRNQGAIVEYTRNMEEPVHAVLRKPAVDEHETIDLDAIDVDAIADSPKKKCGVAKKRTASSASLSSVASDGGRILRQNSQSKLSTAVGSSVPGAKQSKASNVRPPNNEQVQTADENVEGLFGKTVELDKSIFVRKDFVAKEITPHQCSPACLDSHDDPAPHKGRNPLLIPILCGWEREITRQNPNGRQAVCYRAPCARRIRTLVEVDKYLVKTHSRLTVDQFCFDAQLRIDTEYVPVKTFCDIKDLSYGKETVPISAVNGFDRDYPDYVEYSNQRIPAKGVTLNLDPNFLVGCDCTDGCRTRSKCRCIQMTIEATTWSAENKRDSDAGYAHRRLFDTIQTGIYECNSQCKCDSRCANRVVQNGLSSRLQVFKTARRGWGLRCLDDIPAGGFVCIYAGQLLTEHGADEDGKLFGDEYLAELDYIEVVETGKEGYESDVVESDPEFVTAETSGSDDESEEAGASRDSDSTYSGERLLSKRTSNKRRRRKKNGGWKIGKKTLPKSDKPSTKSEGQASELQKRTLKEAHEKTQAWVNKLQTTPTAAALSSMIEISSSDEEDKKDCEAAKGSLQKQSTSLDATANKDVESSSSDSEDAQSGENDKAKNQDGPAKRSARLQAPAVSEPKATKSTCPKPYRSTGKRGGRKSKKTKALLQKTRAFFGEESCYIMDAKSMGNLGRYLNHSCAPNIFVQNVFVDTHDLRFPWVAFFAFRHIRGGTELTWDYNYIVDSVPGKALLCYCGHPECRGRLL